MLLGTPYRAKAGYEEEVVAKADYDLFIVCGRAQFLIERRSEFHGRVLIGARCQKLKSAEEFMAPSGLVLDVMEEPSASYILLLADIYEVRGIPEAQDCVVEVTVGAAAKKKKVFV